MFTASKYEDVRPLAMDQVLKKVAHGKFSCEDIQKRELEIMNAMKFKMGAPTVLEYIDQYLHLCKHVISPKL